MNAVVVRDRAYPELTPWVLSDLSSDGPEIIGNNAPTDPAIHAIITVIEAAVETEAAFEQTDAGFQARPPVATGPKPGLGFMGVSGRGASARFGNGDILHPALRGIGFALR